ncbi:MAG: PIN domain-containing protein [Nitrososphaerales archaeon]
MRIVVNSDRVIAALIRDSKSRHIIFSGKFEFLTIDFAKSEIREHEEEILKKAGLSKTQFETILSILFGKIFVISDLVIKSKMKEAEKIMDKIDPDDAPFIALALATDNDGIWTEDRHFERQKSVRTWRTADLLGLMSTN